MTNAFAAHLRTCARSGARRFLARGLVLASSLAALSVLAGPAAAQALLQQARDDVVFRIEHRVDDPAAAVFLLGSMPELGRDEPRRAIRMQSLDGERWRVVVSLPTNRSYTYSYWVRDRTQNAIGDNANGTPISPVLSGETRSVPLVPKTVFYHSSLDQPVLHYRQRQDDFQELALSDNGPGRFDGERRWATDVGVSQFAMIFHFTNRDGTQRDPVEGNYSTRLERFFVQDGALYTYVPAPTVSPARRDTQPRTIFSDILGTERRYRVMLPRGYDEHVERAYPVLYMYDGQQLWEGSQSWDQGLQGITALVDAGAVGEMILVGVEYKGGSQCQITRNRGTDCLSPEDSVNVPPCGRISGQADRFLGFVVEELKPWIDANYRTLPGREHTFASGYSFGGVFAMYAGWEHSDTFGAVAPQSASFWVPAFPARVKAEPRQPVRIYLDTGDNEQNIYDVVSAMYDNLAGAKGMVLDRSLRYRVGFGQNHSYLNGGRRMGTLLGFLRPDFGEPIELPGFLGGRPALDGTRASGVAPETGAPAAATRRRSAGAVDTR